MAKGRSADPRRQLSPEGSSINVDALGFSLMAGDETIYEMSWSGVQQIFGYTRFRSMSPELCLAFVPAGRPSGQVVVHQHVSGWERLCSSVLDVLPDADRDWRHKAAHDDTDLDQYRPIAAVVPMFTVNSTVVWAR